MSPHRELFDVEEIYRRYWNLLYRTALAKTGDHADSVDIVQELFVHLWNKRDELLVQESLEGYLLVSLRHRIFNHFRNNGVREKVRQDYARFMEALINGAVAVNDEEHRQLAENTVQQAVAQLPEKMKYILVQNKYHHKSIDQLSEELGIAPQTVKNQLTKALHRIERLLRRYHARDISLLLLLLNS